MICMNTGWLNSDFKREVAENENRDGPSDCEVNTPVDGSNILFSIGELSSLLHSSYVITSEIDEHGIISNLRLQNCDEWKPNEWLGHDGQR